MDKPKIRVRAQRVTINDIARYQVVDHTGRRWINHGADNGNHYYDTYHADFFDRYPRIMIEKEEELQYWIGITGGSAGDALELHAPLSKDYDLLPADIDITVIIVIQSTERRNESYYCLEPAPFEDQVDRKSDFYPIIDLSGHRRLIRYDAIKEIEFKVI